MGHLTLLREWAVVYQPFLLEINSADPYNIDMGVLLNLVGLLLTLGAAIVVLRSFMNWRGVLRGGIFLFALGFVSFSAGFLSNIFVSTSSESNLIFFALGAAFLLLGAKKVFSYGRAI